MMQTPKILLIIIVFSCNASENRQSDSGIIQEYVIDEVDLVPEGIAYSKKNNAFYLTSIGKSIIRVSG